MGALTSKNPMGSSGALPRQIPNTFMTVPVAIMDIAQRNVKSQTEYILKVGLRKWGIMKPEKISNMKISVAKCRAKLSNIDIFTGQTSGFVQLVRVPEADDC